MEGARSPALSVAQALVSAWLAGDDDTVSSACTPDVRWWTPLADEPTSGPTDAGAALRRVLAPLLQPVAVTAVVPSQDGSRCVVELRSAGTPPAFLTSVISLRDGKISAGRTYSDLRGLDDRPKPEAS
jgi:ketosteroid isomerase-like protein